MHTDSMHVHYAFEECEPDILKWWDRIQNNPKENADSSKISSAVKRKPYTIIMPPPNVTGSLHLGHALSSTFQDILARFYRMNGRDVVWVPGTDHAGIATQMMVEKEVISQGTSRKELGREVFVQRIWNWKERYGNLIIEQIKRLGFSADWDRHCFTLDPAMNIAVNEAFVRLHQKGYVYRSQRLIHWDGHLKTALSDLEVMHKTMPGKLWHIRYSLVSDPSQGIVVATSRPETLFGDVAVAVHPDDPRYGQWIGQSVRIPLTDRSIPIIADFDVDPEKGTGALKITPAHDFTDFQIGQRHALPLLSILTDENCLNASVPIAFQGLDCSQARTAVLQSLGTALVGESDMVHTIPYSERSGTVVEPRVTLQWFIDMKNMADQAIAAIDAGQMRFVPEEWTNNAMHWLKNIQPWCVSRQLWWGHRLPVWYGPENSIFVATDSDVAYDLARQKWGSEVVLRQDEDVLDTWFSSGLWPFSTLGWPHETLDMHNRLPTNVLVTGFDIIFFWVARMMMLGIEMTGRVPFEHIYIHPLIRDAQGQKMSKTKQNVVNPLDIIEEYGADALRFALAGSSCGKQHMRFSLKNVEQAQHFINKIWNVMRFAKARGVMNVRYNPSALLYKPENITAPLNQWMMDQISKAIVQVNQAIAAYRFSDAAHAVHHFIWHVVCDWYVEWAKREWDHPERGDEVQKIFLYVLGVMIRILHLFMPFISEKIWHDLTAEEGTLFQQSWPESSWLDPDEASVQPVGDHFCAQSEISLASEDNVTAKKSVQGTTTLDDSDCTSSSDNPSTVEAKEVEFSWSNSIKPTASILAWSMVHDAMVLVRRIRSLFALSTSQIIQVSWYGASDDIAGYVQTYHDPLCRWLGLSSWSVTQQPVHKNPEGVVFSILGGMGSLVIPLANVVDMQCAVERLEKDSQKIEKESSALEKRLVMARSQPQTPEEIIADLESRYQENKNALEHIKTTLHAISEASAATVF